MTLVRKYRQVINRTDPEFDSMSIGDRRFLLGWTLRKIRYALGKHNAFYGSAIRIRCENVVGCSKTMVVPGVVVRRVK